eukprot:6420000-Alexandrium_andersonii.AAC.1
MASSADSSMSGLASHASWSVRPSMPRGSGRPICRTCSAPMLSSWSGPRRRALAPSRKGSAPWCCQPPFVGGSKRPQRVRSAQCLSPPS